MSREILQLQDDVNTTRRDLAPLDSLSDEELVLAHREGRVGAFRELHDRYRGRLTSFIRRRTGAGEQAADILQDVWVRVVRHLHRFDPHQPFSTWVFTITANLCKNVLRNRSRNRLILFHKLERNREPDSEPLQFEDNGMKPDRLYEKRVALSVVSEALARLSDEHRKVFHLREIRGKSYQDVADTLGVRLGTVKSRLHRARMRFADLVKEDHGNPLEPF